jgi:AsmA protein
VKKKLLIGLAALSGLVILLLAAAVAVPFFISGNVYRAQVVALIENATGREFRIDGPITFHLLPDLALSAEDVSFANAQGGVAPAMATLKSLDIEIKLRPLLAGKLVITGFVLERPEIALEIDRQGRPNWIFGEALSPAPPPHPAKHKIGDLIALLDRFHLAGFEIRGGAVSYYDARDGEQWHADNIDVKFAMAGLDQPLTADGNATWNGETVYFDYAIARPGAFEGGEPSGIELHVSSHPVDFDFSGDGVGEPEPKLSGAVSLAFPSLRGFAKWTGIPISAAGAGLGRFAIKGDLDVAGETYKFGRAEIDLDAIKGQGEMEFDNSGTRPNVRGSLALQDLDLNPYLGAAGSGDAPTPEAAPETAVAPANEPSADWSDAPIDLSLLKLADVYFEIGTNSIRYRKLVIGQSALNLELKDGVLTATLAKLDLYGGQGQGRLVIDGAAKVPAISESLDMKNVDLELLLRDAGGITVLSGPASLDMAVSGHGKSERDIAQSLTGKGSVHLDKGAIQGVQILDMVHTATKILTLGLGGGGDKTEFERFDASYAIDNGVLSCKDLRLVSSDLPVSGAGEVDLPNRQVVYRLTPKLSGLLAVPVDINGKWDALNFSPDFLSAFGGTAKSLLGVFGGGGQ